MTGSTSYAESLFAIDAVQFEGGAMSQYDHTSDSSGKRVHVHFCPSCGTTVSLSFERWPDFRALSRGTFDEPDWVSINAQIWTRSAQTGVALPSNTDCFAKARHTMNGEPEVPERFETPVMVRKSSA